MGHEDVFNWTKSLAVVGGVLVGIFATYLPSQAAQAVAVNIAQLARSYVVQVAAEKTEADAERVWRSLQERYRSILGPQQVAIRRIDMGERGIFYRAQVGPFTSRAQASEFCGRLRSVSAECVVLPN
jgi:cell division septation protein DedD